MTAHVGSAREGFCALGRDGVGGGASRPHLSPVAEAYIACGKLHHYFKTDLLGSLCQS